MPDDVLIDLMREFLWIGLLLSLPALATAMTIGIVVGLAQAVTSIQEQTLAFVPKLVGIALVCVLLGHWMIRLLERYTAELISSLPKYGAM
jgi:flagellar biosynthetic protein FliQ